jgi:hypothetical protein
VLEIQWLPTAAETAFASTISRTLAVEVKEVSGKLKLPRSETDGRSPRGK